MRLVAASDDIVAKELDGEVVIVNMANGIYYSLNRIGSFVWSQSEAGVPLERVRAILKDAYSGPIDSDLDLFVERLVDAKLVELENDASLDITDALPVLPTEYAAPELHAYEDVADMIALDPPLPEVEQYKKVSS